MTRDDILRLLQECGFGTLMDHPIMTENMMRFAALVAEREREACAKVCEEKQNYSMPIPCPDGIEGCCVAHVVPARREKTGSECAAAIRARGET